MNAMVQDMSWESIANGEGAGIFDLSEGELEEIHGAGLWGVIWRAVVWIFHADPAY